MRSFLVFSFIALFMFVAWGFSKWLQKKIRPADSLGRLLLFFLLVLISIFALSFLMVFTITKFFPGELMK